MPPLSLAPLIGLRRPAQPVTPGMRPATVALVLILAATALRIVYLMFWSPLDLAPDEAHYWDWSRHLDWSYYSKGPLVAWLIRLSCELTGGLFEAACGSLVPAVRLPAVVCGALILSALYIMASRHLNGRWGLAAVIAGLTMPPLGVGSIVMTIDAPYCACWCWALVFTDSALRRGRSRDWLMAGVAVGVGILAKYTMGVFALSLALWWLVDPAERKRFAMRGPWLAAAVAALCCTPIIAWNVLNDFVTFRHVAVQAGVKTESLIRWKGPLEYLGGQFGLLFGYWFVAWALAVWRYAPWKVSDANTRFLWWLSVPSVALFGVVSLRSNVQINWPIAAYLSGVVLALMYLREQVRTRPRSTAIGFTIASTIGLLVTLAAMNSNPLRPMLAALTPPPSMVNPYPLRKVDPSCRLRGWRYLGEQVDLVRDWVRASEGVEPVLTGYNWQTPGALGFYCSGQPQAYSLGLAIGDRHSQYDLWHPNPLADAQEFTGRTFIVVGEGYPALAQAFDEVSEPVAVVYVENGQPIAGWSVWVCKGYKGFPPEAFARHQKRF